MKKMLFVLTLSQSLSYANTLQCTTNTVPANVVARLDYEPYEFNHFAGHAIIAHHGRADDLATEYIDGTILVPENSPFIGKTAEVYQPYNGVLRSVVIQAGTTAIPSTAFPPSTHAAGQRIWVRVYTGHDYAIKHDTAWSPSAGEITTKIYTLVGGGWRTTTRTSVVGDYTQTTDELAFPDSFDHINLIAGETVQITALNKTLSTNVIDLSFNSTSADTDNGTLIVNNISVPGQKQTTVPGADRYKLEWKTPTVATPGAQTRTYTVSWTCP